MVNNVPKYQDKRNKAGHGYVQIEMQTAILLVVRLLAAHKQQELYREMECASP